MSPQSPIHISLNIDSAYVRFCCVTLASIFESNHGSCFCIHILCNQLSSDETATIRSLVARYGSKVFFYTPDKSLLEGFQVRKFSKRISLATYYRCILSAVLPETIKRVIYLDCDLLVLGSLVPLWETDLQGIGIAGVRDIAADDERRYQILEYPSSHSYFNAGVLLINLEYWRQHHIAEASINLYREHPERILFNDQDILNILFHDNKIELDRKFNMQDGFYRRKCKIVSLEELQSPIILHFTNRKPWEYDNQHPLRHLFFKFQDITIYSDLNPMHSISNRIKRFFYLLPYKLHIRKPKYITL